MVGTPTILFLDRLIYRNVHSIIYSKEMCNMFYKVNRMVTVEVVVMDTKYDCMKEVNMYLGDKLLGSKDFSVGNATCDMENENAAWFAVFEEVFGEHYRTEVVA